jgi:LmbE family N-acetylglucosaminyl deacetylase
MAMELVVDELHPGTDESTWLRGGRLRALRPLHVVHARRLVVVAPHPDDEVLGCGGLLQQAHRLGMDVMVVAVTDGEASHPAAHRLGHGVGAARGHESRVALQRLGCGSASVVRLGIPDGAVASRSQDLADVLSGLLGPDDVCVAPWRSDGHPDHDATGSAALAAGRATRTPVLEYLVWAWHWATPDSAAVPWRHCRRLDLDSAEVARKRWATCAFESQIKPSASEAGQGPILTATMLRRFWRPFEVFIGGDR